METLDKPKKRYLHPDRVTLSQVSLSKISGWIDQAVSESNGMTVSKSNLVEWLIESHSETLTIGECKKIREKFSDELKFHEWAIREFKKQKAQGLEASFFEFLAQNQFCQKVKTDQVNPVRKKLLKVDKVESTAKETRSDELTSNRIPSSI